MGIKEKYKIGQDLIDDFCKENNIKNLSIFGSALRNELTDASDIDLLVEFKSGFTPGYFDLYRMEEELSLIFGGRKIDLRTPSDLSRYFREDVLASAEVLYFEAR